MRRIVKYAIVERGQELDFPITHEYPTLKKLIVGIKNKIDNGKHAFDIEMCFFKPTDLKELSIMSHRQMFFYDPKNDHIDIYNQRNLKHTKDVKRVMRKLMPLVLHYGVKNV